jgi:NADPH-dependent 2,4-dienoyl-CoA reductase/sulfur reductase-like enzyme/nitrite reductase/ring-hydroxylating ferredoxin subunit
MGGQSELEGPDFRLGLAVTEVPDGSLVPGHVDGESAVLHRRGDEFFALGGTCTHYNGPMAEGLVVGDTIRCPWHHACYSLHTGKVLGAPALNDLPAWTVEVRGGRIYVTNRKPAETPPSITLPDSVVIIGAGAAGERAAETLRREGYVGAVTLIDAGKDLPFDKPNLSKDYLAGSAPEEWIPLRGANFYAEQKITLLLGRKATAIDKQRRKVTLDDATTIPFGALLLATGSAPIRLPASVAQGEVYYLRTFADSKAILAAANQAKRAVVIGASFIGLEVAASLRTRGLDVDVVAPELIPLERVLGAELGRFVRDKHEAQGVRFHLGRTISRIDGTVTLDDGSKLSADLVVAGIGVRPVTDLAEAAGLEVDQGILVDEYLQTSVPGIYAAGDLARWPYADTGERVRIEHWVVAQRQGAAVARNMLGRQEPYRDVPFFWSAHYDVVIAYVGNTTSWDKLEIEGELAATDCMVRYIRGGRTVAAASIFRDRESLQIEADIEQRMKGALEPAWS